MMSTITAPVSCHTHAMRITKLEQDGSNDSETQKGMANRRELLLKDTLKVAIQNGRRDRSRSALRIAIHRPILEEGESSQPTGSKENFDGDPLDNPSYVFHELHVCRERGSDGPPTYDKAGYELNYDKVMQWHNASRRRPRPRKPEKVMEELDRRAREQ